MEKRQYPQPRMTLEKRKKFLVYLSEKEFILKSDMPKEVKEEKFKQLEFDFLKDMQNDVNNFTKADY